MNLDWLKEKLDAIGVTSKVKAFTDIQPQLQGMVSRYGIFQRRADAYGTAIIKGWSSYLGAATGGGNTRHMVFASRFPFSSIEVGYCHLGGYGGATGIKALAAVTDDPGPLDYSLGTSSTTLKKAITPKRGGTEYNTITADGWRQVLWSGSSITTATDAGAGGLTIAWSDVLPLQAIQASDGLYYGLVRVTESAGPYTRGAYAGSVTGTQFADDAGFAKIGLFSRTGDMVTDPSVWGVVNTPVINDSPAPNLMIRLRGLSAAAPLSIMFVGDSRFDVVTETAEAAVAAYRTCAFKAQQALTASGKPSHLVRVASGGFTTAQYQQNGLAVLNVVAPDAAVYLVYSINDGAPTRALVDAAKARAVDFVRTCNDKGVACLLVSSFPRGGMSGAENTLLVELDSWCAQSGLPYISPLVLYGDGTGKWGTNPATGGSWSTDGTNHMTQAGYADLASRISATLISAALV